MREPITTLAPSGKTKSASFSICRKAPLCMASQTISPFGVDTVSARFGFYSRLPPV